MPSTVIENFSYNAQTGQLNIRFVSGKVYVYNKVPEPVYEGMKTAFSKGKYFNYNIKDKYRFKRLKED